MFFWGTRLPYLLRRVTILLVITGTMWEIFWRVLGAGLLRRGGSLCAMAQLAYRQAGVT